jgi:hypothetical protein
LTANSDAVLATVAGTALKIATYNVNGVNGRLPRLLEWLDGEPQNPRFEQFT